ncbi:Arabinanase/levansucrase/invertase [Fomitiporia mediterranea MF3/22]|uniref:Arabinanase/levansucrase/invertase n=1 Tax=Fomitiporia mediterranea (strain MF3/22) TaxID=694068 RepID=UPI0004408094|nr:Arabinanase/levansucrase/invertase [Fomitiporia mediterranea MF3/22]EJD01761.1 Arabinanase/levansucrase/invertase [Fomitiporia mediterranea MF3/22]
MLLTFVALANLFLPFVHAYVGFTNPLKSTDGSDPFMVHNDGFYYLLTTTWSNVQITGAATISGLKTATPTVVWSDSTASRCCNVWAPELHQIDGIWYIYYTAGVSTNINNQHINVLQGGTNPMDAYSWKSTIIPDVWAIDATVANLANAWYIFFSATSPNGLQSLYGAKMANPYTVTGSYSLISEPTLSWERDGAAVNEGPQVLINGTRAWMTYSASYCWTDGYSLGQLTWTGGDPLSASSWAKYTAGPVFSSANGDYGPGHNGFFTSPDGSMTYIVYHASATSDVACDGTRRTFAQPVYWHTDGSPNFGDPRPVSDLIPVPPGDGS